MALEDAQLLCVDWNWQQIDVQDRGDLTQVTSAFYCLILYWVMILIVMLKKRSS